MRKEARNNISVNITNVDGYHGGNFSSESYAFEGFRGGNKYYTSDRFIKLDSNYKRVDGKELRGFGIEIEMECSGISSTPILAEVLNKIVFTHFPDGLFKLQRDGSLSGHSSAEAITQIMTREFVRNHYSAFKAMYDTYFPAFHISCADSGNCGMHVNISRAVFGKTEAAQTEAVRRLYYIVNHYFRFCCGLFYRDPRYTSYSAQMRSEKDYCRRMDLSSFGSSHGVCFNLGHWDTGRIEIRLVGGQKNYACFRNTMEAVFFLCERVKALSWADCDDLAKIFSGCNQYVFDRLKSYCAQQGTITAAQLDAIRPTVKREELL